MCDLTIASIALGVVSTGAQMMAQQQQQKSAERAARAQADYNNQVAANEMETQRQLAQNELAKGAAERNRLLRAGSQRMGEMRSQLAGSGFEMDSGSSLSLLGDSAAEIQYDANIISQNANMAAWQHQANAVGAQNNAAWSSYQADQAKTSRTAAWLNMGGTLLGGLGAGLGKYDAWKSSSSPQASGRFDPVGNYHSGVK